MLLKLVREGLGRIIIFIDWVTQPKQLHRSLQQQSIADTKARNLQLYQLYACPFCVKARRTIKRLNLKIETRNVQQGSPYRDELEQGGGRIQVPCLRIRDNDQDTWMYESSDIIQYLNTEFSEQGLESEIASQHQN